MYQFRLHSVFDASSKKKRRVHEDGPRAFCNASKTPGEYGLGSLKNKMAGSELLSAGSDKNHAGDST